MLDGIFSVRVPRTLIFPIACALLTSCLEPGQGVSAARGALPTAAAMGSVSGTHLLILDEDAINNGNTRNRFSARDVNDDIATVGLRKTVRYFRDHIGKEIVLPAGKMGDEGWFAPKTTWAAWSAAGPEVGNGFLNYVVAGPGLGRCDSKGKRETLLDKVPDVVPLRAAGLAALKGRSFCVVVMDGDVRMQSLSPLKADLRGPNLGKAAFEVLQVSPPSGRASELPEVKIRILNADVVCDNPLTPLPDVPVPGTYCDNDGGVCRPNELLIEESWNTLDTTKWVFDGDGLVANGFFQAREDARSAMADWIMPCPVRLESNSAVRFANRLHLDLAQQHDFAEAGALFFVQAGPMGSSENYVFLNVGYTLSPSKVFVELFGADGGTQFDQFLTTSLDHQPSLDFDLDLWIDRGSYRVGVNGEAIDTVRLSKPIEKLSLFEVGAQQLGLGLRGLVDKTGITRTCKSECKLRPRKQERCEPCKSCQWIDCGSRTCNTKSDIT
ncbi:MAG TPA: hypothetical protein VK465_12885, partial [Fibrobacteria bacterium]|nr:hypothetical protein [Fibrobacteria bacterium]